MSLFAPVSCMQQWGTMAHQSRDPFPSWNLPHYTGSQCCFYFFIKDKLGTRRPAALQEKPFWPNVKYKTPILTSTVRYEAAHSLKQQEESSSLSTAVFTANAVQLIQHCEETEQKRVPDFSNVAFAVIDRRGKRSPMYNPNTLSTGSYLFP